MLQLAKNAGHDKQTRHLYLTRNENTLLSIQHKQHVQDAAPTRFHTTLGFYAPALTSSSSAGRNRIHSQRPDTNMRLGIPYMWVTYTWFQLKQPEIWKRNQEQYSAALLLYIYIYIYVCVCAWVCRNGTVLYIYIYIYSFSQQLHRSSNCSMLLPDSRIDASSLYNTTCASYAKLHKADFVAVWRYALLTCAQSTKTTFASVLAWP